MSPSNDPTVASFDPQSQPWLRPRDRLCIVAVVLLGCLLLLANWISHDGTRGGVVDADGAPRQATNFKVDINVANPAELALLPDIGETLASRIVAWRDEHGPFSSWDQLRKVKGVGPKKLESIRPFLMPISPPDERIAPAVATAP